MFNLRLIIPLGLFLFTTLSLAQIEVVYDVEYVLQPNIKEIIDQNQTGYDLWSTHIANMKNLRGVLRVCDNQSYFSILDNSPASTTKPILTTVLIEETCWLTDRNKSLRISRSKNVAIEADYTKNPWVFTGDKKVIAGFVCEKAYKKLYFESQPEIDQLIVVWFTTNIPVDSGMIDATGVPGLILLYTDYQHKYIAKQVTKLDKCKISVPDLKKITFTEANNAAAARNKARGLKFDD